MELKFWLGDCVWDTPMMLWLIFGGSTLSIYGVVGMESLDATVHPRALARTGRTVCHLCADCPCGPSGRVCGM
jgi:hypothetical protein